MGGTIINIAVCDDIKCYREKIIRLCRDYERKHQISMNCMEFASGEEVLASTSKMDLLFLDIDLPKMSGIDVMRQLETNDRITYIIFITGYSEFVFDAFSCKTVGFLLKPFDTDRFERYMNKVVHKSITNNKIEIPDGDHKININTGTIRYIEALGSYSRIVTKANSHMIRCTLADWEERLKNCDFIRIHKSYLVNLAYIIKINKTVIIDNDVELKISRRKLVETKERYAEYSMKRAW